MIRVAQRAKEAARESRGFCGDIQLAKLAGIKKVMKWDAEGGPLENSDTDVAHAAMMYAVAVIIEMEGSDF